jgi:hypothetical protein
MKGGSPARREKELNSSSTDGWKGEEVVDDVLVGGQVKVTRSMWVQRNKWVGPGSSVMLLVHCGHGVRGCKLGGPNSGEETKLNDSENKIVSSSREE